MSEAFPIDNETYRYIVDTNNFLETILVPIAADDEVLKRVLAWILENDIDGKVADDYYDFLGEHLDSTYDMPSEMCNRVYDACETNLREEEFHHGET